MNKKIQYMCLWSAPLMGIFVTIGWWLLAKFVPPPLPSWGPEEIAAFYSANTNGIRTGMIFMIIGVAFFFPFIGLLAHFIRKMEGDSSTLAYTQLLSGALSAVIILLPAMFWTIAAFRPERSPELVQLLNDMGWLVTAMPFAPGVIQNLSLGIAILNDKNTPALMPRWIAYLNFWMAALYVPAGLMTYFKTGPFAWNGLIAFWLALVAFGIWFNVVIFGLLKAIQSPSNK